MSELCRLRLRLPNGAELEVSGTAEYVAAERIAFLGLQQAVGVGRANTASIEPRPEGSVSTPKARTPPAAPEATQAPIRSPVWDAIIETSRGPNIQLRAKLQNDRTDKDACLVLLAAAQKMLNLPKPTASQVARWLRASGYPIQRVDRVISDSVQKGEILAAGSRRARRYQLTGPGRVKGFLLAQQLSDLISAE